MNAATLALAEQPRYLLGDVRDNLLLELAVLQDFMASGTEAFEVKPMPEEGEFVRLSGSAMTAALTDAGIIPDVVPSASSRCQDLLVSFGNGAANVTLGNELTPTQVCRVRATCMAWCPLCSMAPCVPGET